MHGLEPGLCLAVGARRAMRGAFGRERMMAAAAQVLHGWVVIVGAPDVSSRDTGKTERLSAVYGQSGRRWHTIGVRILLIEDDPRLAERTAEYLRDHEAEVEIAGDGEAGLSRAQAGEHDIVLLDLMLPGIDGLEVCKRLRKTSKMPVIMLTARGEEVDRVVGLELGADDYLPKPFSPRELLARIRAVLRRHNASPDAETTILEVDALTIDRDRRVATLAGEPVELTAYQFDLLWALAEGTGKVLGREQLFSRVRQLRGDPQAEFDPSVDRSIDVHLSKIRASLGSVAEVGKTLIRTVRGVGYVLGGDDG